MIIILIISGILRIKVNIIILTALPNFCLDRYQHIFIMIAFPVFVFTIVAQP